MGSWRHRLSGVNPTTRRATCLECGPVAIVRKQTQWKCRTARKEQRQGKQYGEYVDDGSTGNRYAKGAQA